MLEKFVTPILDTLDELSELENGKKEIENQRSILSKEYTKKISSLDKNLLGIDNNAYDKK